MSSTIYGNIDNNSKFNINNIGDVEINADTQIDGNLTINNDLKQVLKFDNNLSLLEVGTNDISPNGKLFLYGGQDAGGTINDEGGEIRLYNSTDGDFVYDFWRLDVTGNSLRIGPTGVFGCSFTQTTATNFNVPGGISANDINAVNTIFTSTITGTLAVTGTSGINTLGTNANTNNQTYTPTYTTTAGNQQSNTARNAYITMFNRVANVRGIFEIKTAAAAPATDYVIRATNQFAITFTNTYDVSGVVTCKDTALNYGYVEADTSNNELLIKFQFTSTPSVGTTYTVIWNGSFINP